MTVEADVDADIDADEETAAVADAEADVEVDDLVEPEARDDDEAEVEVEDDDVAPPGDGDGVGEGDPPVDPSPVHSWAWHATRVSSLFLFVLLPLHALVTIVAGDVGGTSAATMFVRLQNPWWRATEWITLTLALLHGCLALLAHVDRGVSRPRLATALRVATIGTTVVVGALAARVLATYG